RQARMTSKAHVEFGSGAPRLPDPTRTTTQVEWHRPREEQRSRVSWQTIGSAEFEQRLRTSRFWPGRPVMRESLSISVMVPWPWRLLHLLEPIRFSTAFVISLMDRFAMTRQLLSGSIHML